MLAAPGKASNGPALPHFFTQHRFWGKTLLATITMASGVLASTTVTFQCPQSCPLTGLPLFEALFSLTTSPNAPGLPPHRVVWPLSIGRCRTEHHIPGGA